MLKIEEAMREAAIQRMKLLKLSEETIEAFVQRGELRISHQVYAGSDPEGDASGAIRQKAGLVSYKGMLYSLSTAEATPAQQRFFDEKKDDYLNGPDLIYHVHRLEIDGQVWVTFFRVGADVDRWDAEAKSVAGGNSFEFVAYPGDEGWRWCEYEQVFCMPVEGRLFRAYLPDDQEEALRFIESAELRTHLRDGSAQLRNDDYAKIIASAPASIELKIPVLERISWQAAPVSKSRDYDAASALAAFRAALDERYENNPPGTVFLLHIRWLGAYGSFGQEEDFWRLFSDFDEAVRFIRIEKLPRLEEASWRYRSWYEIIKYKPDDEGNMIHEIKWTLNAYGDIWYFHGGREFLHRHGFLDYRASEAYLGEIGLPAHLRFCRSSIDLPVPYQPGDMLSVDLCPFAEQRYVVAAGYEGGRLQCIYEQRGKLYCFPLEDLYGWGYMSARMLLSSLYRAQRMEWQEGEEGLLIRISAAIKANPGLGREMMLSLWGEEQVFNYEGVEINAFLENFQTG
ncbi:MAG: hypothetical protein FWH28_00640 [Clostridiales bacterium]|nr:hypothetical protein [Clostridiales bacterium]